MLYYAYFFSSNISETGLISLFIVQPLNITPLTNVKITNLFIFSYSLLFYVVYNFLIAITKIPIAIIFESAIISKLKYVKASN